MAIDREKSLEMIKSSLDDQYSKKQLEVIANTLAHSLDVRYLLSPCFSSSQMLEIEKGLKDGVDVSKYADPMIPETEMKQIRKSLKEEQSDYEGDKFKQVPAVSGKHIDWSLKTLAKFNMSYIWMMMFGNVK